MNQSIITENIPSNEIISVEQYREFTAIAKKANVEDLSGKNTQNSRLASDVSIPSIIFYIEKSLVQLWFHKHRYSQNSNKHLFLKQAPCLDGLVISYWCRSDKQSACFVDHIWTVCALGITDQNVFAERIMPSAQLS